MVEQYDSDDYSIEESDHGGGCCGITRLHDFYDLSEAKCAAEKKAIIQGALNDFPSKKQQHLYEVVLTDHQLKQGWLSVLRKAGFVRGPRFRNSNSGNICNVFYHYDADVPKYVGVRKQKKAASNPFGR